MSHPLNVSAHPISTAFRRLASMLIEQRNAIQIFGLLVSVTLVWMAGFLPLIGWLTFLLYLFAAPYAGAFLLNVSHAAFSGRRALPPFPGKSDLLGFVSPGLAHMFLLVGLFVDIFPSLGLLLVWGAFLGFLAMPLNHAVNGGFPDDWEDWGAWTLGAGVCSAAGAMTVLAYEYSDALGPIGTMIPLMGALVLTIFSSALAGELNPWTASKCGDKQ